jgi:ribosomal protein L29
MQITINIPDNLPQAVVEQQISEFEQKLINLTTNLASKKTEKLKTIQQIIKRCASIPTIDNRSPDQILGYKQSSIGIVGLMVIDSSVLIVNRQT